MMSFFRAVLVIARRDFTATVYSRSFLFFLLGPLVILGISVLFGSVTQNLAKEDVRMSVAAVANDAEFAAMQAVRQRLGAGLSDQMLPELVQARPEAAADAQVRNLLASRAQRIIAVMTGGLDRPELTGPVSEDGSVKRQMILIVDEARRTQALAAAGVAVPPTAMKVNFVGESAGVLASAQAITARAGQLLLFMLTVLLAGMLLSNMIEEKSNKVIEVLAAAVPVDAIFVGKIFAMLTISLVGIGVWACGGLLAMLLQPQWLGGLPPPAVGWPLFILFVLLYYSANYLLLGALFLGIGSQASSVREVQTLSMPVTVGQMLIFLFASVAVGQYDHPIGIAAAIFPFSSPLTMISRAAQTPELWPHLLALVWQALWVWLTVSFGAALFRRNVLKSGAGGRARRPRRA
jgi:ABC-2 type transport system permease protein